LRVPTVDIGDRQRGRLAAASVVHCEPTRSAIGQAFVAAYALDCSAVKNPYGDGHTAARIVDLIRALPPASALLKKHFHVVASTQGEDPHG
jgi:UDP-N-acetylglucosamine 2-epimerase